MSKLLLVSRNKHVCSPSMIFALRRCFRQLSVVALKMFCVPFYVKRV